MANSSSWFRVEARSGVTPTLYIYDVIGAYGVNAKDFAAELRKLGELKGKPLNLRLNTPGGNVFMGNAIYNLLKESGAVITVYVDGVAASMGSVIAMVGERIIMAENAVLMIHNPAGGVEGGAADMARMATLLETLKDGMVTAYAPKSGLSRDAVAKIMDDETWLDAEEAVAAGFADEIGGALQVAAFDLTKFKYPPEPSAGNQGGLDMTKEELAAAMAENNTALISGIGAAIATALKPAAPEANATKAKTEAEIRDEVKATMKAYADEVTSLCALAGLPGEAAAFITAETPVAEVRTKLVAKQAEAKARKPGGGNLPSNHTGSLVEGNAGADEDISDLVPKPEAHSVVWDRFNGRQRKTA
jgi:ATP-dependent Clp protease protease subunit